MDVNQHYAALLGLGDEWTVTNVVLDVPGKRVDVYVEYAQKSADSRVAASSEAPPAIRIYCGFMVKLAP